MGCADIPNWYLRNRVPVIDLRSPTWAKARAAVLPSGYEPATCMARLAASGRIRRIARGRWQVVDPSREPPDVAIADALVRDTAHYITTDAALAAAGMIDQPLPSITVVTHRRLKPVPLGHAIVRAVTVSLDRLRSADAFDTVRDGYAVRLASPVQAVVDALAEPAWMDHFSLLPEVLAHLDDTELATVASGSLERSGAAAARLGYLLEEAARAVPPVLAAFRPSSRTELRPGRRGPYSTRWRVYG